MRYIVYHGNCIDGFTAAWVCHLKYSDATFLEEFHGDPKNGTDFAKTKWLLENATKQDDIIFVDICPSRELLVTLHAKVKSLFVWDHHKSAERFTKDLPYVTIDQHHSGAGIAWYKCHPKYQVPFLVQLVEDRDLWKWEIPDAEKYLMIIDMLKKDFDVYTDFSKLLENIDSRSELLERAEMYLEYKQYCIRRSISRNKLHVLNIAGHLIPAINANDFQSEIGAQLSEKAPAACVYYRSNNAWLFSLRSAKENPEHLDVEVLASKYGGGGHKHAAGFTLESLDSLVFEDISETLADKLLE